MKKKCILLSLILSFNIAFSQIKEKTINNYLGMTISNVSGIGISYYINYKKVSLQYTYGSLGKDFMTGLSTNYYFFRNTKLNYLLYQGNMIYKFNKNSYNIYNSLGAGIEFMYDKVKFQVLFGGALCLTGPYFLFSGGIGIYYNIF